MQEPENTAGELTPPAVPAVGTDEYYRLNYSDSSKPKAYFGFECEVFEDIIIPRMQFVQAVANGSPTYQQLRAAGFDCLYDDGTGEPPRLLQNFVETSEQFKELCRIIDPAVAQEQGW